MSGYNGIPVPTKALWTWSQPVSGQEAQVVSFPTIKGCPTKSGVQAKDLEQYMQIPLVQAGPPPQAIPVDTITGWIRYAEDDIEAQTNVRLCQTWMAAPAAKSSQETQALNLAVSGAYQQPGIDYDVEEPGYDFFFDRWRDEGWGYMRLRNRPVKSVSYYDPSGFESSNFTGMKNVAFIYPLLNEYFRMPNTWFVEDQNRGLIRFVPATSVQMLPLFAMQLAFMGFAQDVPQGLWFQYTCGLTASDYRSDWSFMRELVLAKAAIRAFSAIQTGINLGAMEVHTIADGLSQRIRYSEKGPFGAQIAQENTIVTSLLKRAKAKGGGFHMGIL
jgi:hypothetical protein